MGLSGPIIAAVVVVGPSSVDAKWLVTSGRREEEEKEGADPTLKTKTPHVNVGNKLSFAKNLGTK